MELTALDMDGQGPSLPKMLQQTLLIPFLATDIFGIVSTAGVSIDK
jgi:hypothetical protein